jgi:hypothetical protein
MLTTNITDLCQRASDEELSMIRAIASQHTKWRNEHKKEWSKIKSTGLCLCGQGSVKLGEIRDRGYMYGIECIHCM